MATKNNRREFLIGSAAFSFAAAGSTGQRLFADEKSDDHEEAEISAPEDLMREHGVLNRILLVYEEAAGRLRHKEDVPAEIFQKPAEMVRKFVEDYHEKLEENFIFPQFEKHKKLTDLVAVLRQQHKAGRTVTDKILHNTAPGQYGRASARHEVVQLCDSFIRMYRPHEAREDTVLFPALYEIISAKEVKDLGEQFEDEEHRLFGKEGFEENVEKIAAIEKELGIYNLAQFTPKV
ncbi:MAG TPA: hemerythrin domain-containing protein [Lacipirellulaceae bacterium]|nr:hemerythrin domain-containing protein [Lacipirellulaceae bacterium]